MDFDDGVPGLSDSLSPPLVCGAASLAARLTEGVAMTALLEALSGPFDGEQAMLAASFDTAVLAFLSARRELGLSLQDDVLAHTALWRVKDGPGISDAAPPLRLLALAAPGDLQMNTPIEFITHHLNVRLDILYVLPGRALPALLPEHDVAMCIVSDSDPDTLARLIPLLARWPRPVLNHPGRIAGSRIGALTRDGIARLFREDDGITAPATIGCGRAVLAAHLAAGASIGELTGGVGWPLLIRPVGSHAGHLLERLNGEDELGVYLDSVSGERFFLSRFVDYRSADGLYRKYRVAMISGAPFLCHMGVSDHWMIHYQNAGMGESAAKRDDEAAAMAAFDSGFAVRHAAALRTLSGRLGLDHVVLDCAEAPEGTLLLFEVEMAAIIHLLDPVDLFAYKQPQMRRVFAAFDGLLRDTVKGACAPSVMVGAG